MKLQGALVFLLIFLIRSGESGTPCPSAPTVFPCFCSNSEDGTTTVMCPGMQNISHLEEASKPLKSLIVDHLYMLNTFTNDPYSDDSLNEVDSKSKMPVHGMFPKKWLSEFRVRNLEIQGGKLDGFFLTDDAFEGQADFLTSLVIKKAGLRGHVCSTCSPPSPITGFSTRELRRTPLLRYVDLSNNKLEILDGKAFPEELKDLKKIILSNNQINRINKDAFSNLHQLSYLDLSRNRLTAVSRNIFRSSDTMLNTIDLSYNSIQALPKDMFQSLHGLKEIKLSHNLLETLPGETWTKIPSLLEKIDLRGNFLICNCTMNWIQRRMSKTTKLVAQCVGPKSVEFQDLKPNLSAFVGCT